MWKIKGSEITRAWNKAVGEGSGGRTEEVG